LILTNTPSLYSTVIYGRGISNQSRFLDRALSANREFMVADGQEFILGRFIAPASATVQFASALNRSVTGLLDFNPKDILFVAARPGWYNVRSCD
jgi:uncharacterized protein DUF6933